MFHGKKINTISQIDFLLILFSAIASFFLRLSSNNNIFDYLSFLYFLIGLSLVIKPIMLYIFHCFEFGSEITVNRFLVNFISAISISSGLIFVILLTFHDTLHILDGFPRSVVLIDWMLSMFLLGGYHLYQHKRDLLVGSEKEDISLLTNWEDWRNKALGYFSPISFTLSIYLIANFQYAGTAMPVSGQIKRWWGTLPNTVYGQPIKTFSGIVKGLLDSNRERGPFWLLTQPLSFIVSKMKMILGYPQVEDMFDPILIVLIVWIIFSSLIYLIIVNQSRKYKKYIQSLALLPLFTGAMFHAISYKSTGYLHTRSWYWMSEVILIVLFLGILLAILMKMIEEKSWGKKFVSAFTFLLCGAIWGMFTITILQQFSLNRQGPLEYNLHEEIQFMKSHTEPGDVIGMTGGGLTAYFIPDRTIVNLDGLINSADYFRKLQDGETTEYLLENNVKYIYGEELILLDSDPYRWIFADTLTDLEKGPFFNLYTYKPSAHP